MPPPGHGFGGARAGFGDHYARTVQRGGSANRSGSRDTFAMVVRGEDAHRLHLKTISDAIGPAAGWRTWRGLRVLSRVPTVLAGLEKAYGAALLPDGPARWSLACSTGHWPGSKWIWFAGNSTDGPIRALGFTVLEDDRHYFPPYEAVPLIRQGLAAAASEDSGRFGSACWQGGRRRRCSA